MRLSCARFSRNLAKLLDEVGANKLEQYSKFNPSPVSISHFLEFGRSASTDHSYLFMRKEIPVRLANMMKELELLPVELQQQPNCCLTQDFYVQSFQDILRFENAPNTPSVRDEFTKCLQNIRIRHKDVVPTMAEAVMMIKSEHSSQHLDKAGVTSCIQYFLDRLYMSRISIHMLINQHTILYGDETPDSPIHVGSIDPSCDVPRIVQDAFNNAAFLCDQYYLQSPKMELEVVNAVDGGATVQTVYVPAHLYHILFELFKNALRATVEAHEDQELPAVKVLVAKSTNDVSIKISDRGGGIPRYERKELFKYFYSTAPTPLLSGGGAGSAPLAGLGYGLPLARLYARYFYGDIYLSSVDGYGTDATLYLQALAKEASEVLPIFNQKSKQHYEKPKPMVADWTDPTSNLGTYFNKGRPYSGEPSQRKRNKSDDEKSTGR